MLLVTGAIWRQNALPSDQLLEMYRAGLMVGLGTDGAASNNSQDMLEQCQM